jgi:hypothetical protein
MGNALERMTGMMERVTVAVINDASEHREIKYHCYEEMANLLVTLLAPFENMTHENILSWSGLDVLRNPRRALLD